LLNDQPGLLGPKALLAYQLLCYSRDEVVWSIKHSARENQNKRTSEDDFKDRAMVELLFFMEDLRTVSSKFVR
jgi:NCK-associated protein 1